MNAKRHHIVPQEYLKQWSGCSDNKVWVKRRDGNAFHAHVKNVAVQGYFYPDKVETFFANQVENPVAGIWERLTHERGEEELSRADRFHIAQFTIYQGFRTRQFMEKMEVLENAQLEKYIRLYRRLAGDEAFVHDNSRGLYIPEVLRFEESVREDYPNLFHRLLGDSDKLAGYARKYADSQWVLCNATGGAEFVTTDNPVVDLAMEDFPHQIFMPVGPKCLLMMRGAPFYLDAEGTFDDSVVDSVNKVLCEQSSEVYASSKAMVDEYSEHLSDYQVYFDNSGDTSYYFR